MGRLNRIAPLFTVLVTAGMTFAEEPSRSRNSSSTSVPTVVYAGASALSATLSHADVAAMRSVVQPNLLKGGFGEAHMNRHLTSYLRQTGDWLPLRSRLGPQGMDGLSIQYDSRGSPRGLLVSEAKYGTSRLKMTADGIQMGAKWRSIRLARMASEYRSIADTVRSGGMKIAGPGGSVGQQRLQVPLADGKKAAVFTRSRSGAPWEFVGPRELAAQAGRQADLVGNYLQLASEGKISYESWLYRIELKDGFLRVTIKDASLVGELGSESRLTSHRTIPIPLRGARLEQLKVMSRVEIAKLIQQHYPAMAASDIERYSREIVRSTKDFENLFAPARRSLVATGAWNSLKVGGILATIDVAVQAIGQYRQTGVIDWRQVGLSGGMTLVATAAGSGAGQGVIAIVTRNPIAYQFMQRTSSLLGVGSASLTTNALGGMAGGGVASLLFAYGGYFTGLYDLDTANRMALSGGAGTVAGAAFGVGMFSLASAIGTASTGTAIVALHGVAATNATLAWLGGGSLAAGGFGVGGGAVVVTGGTILIAFAAAAVVHVGFIYVDEKRDRERIRLTIDDLKSRTRFTIVGIGTQRFDIHAINQQ